MSQELGSATVRLGAHKARPHRNVGSTWLSRAGRDVGCTPFAARLLVTVARSQRSCPTFFLLVAVDFGRIVSFVLFGGILTACPILAEIWQNI